jgi:hypothetical protein
MSDSSDDSYIVCDCDHCMYDVGFMCTNPELIPLGE